MDFSLVPKTSPSIQKRQAFDLKFSKGSGTGPGPGPGPGPGLGPALIINGAWGVGRRVGRRLHQTIRLFIYHFLAPKGPKAGGQELEVSQIQVPLANGAGRAGPGGGPYKTGEGNYILGLV